MYRLLLTIFLGITLSSAQTIVTKKIIVGEGDKDSMVEVETMRSDSTIRIIIDRDGEIEELEFPFDGQLTAEIKEKLKDLDIDIILDGKHFKHGKYFSMKERAWLGVQIQDLSDQLREYFGVKHDGGVLISEVVKDSPADKAGFEAGDIVMKLDDINISDSDELRKVVRKQKPESDVTIQYIRNRKVKKTNVKLGEMKPDHRMSWFDKDIMFDHPKFKDDFEGLPGDKKMKKFRFYDDDDDLREEMDQLKKEIEKLKTEIEKLSK